MLLFLLSFVGLVLIAGIALTIGGALLAVGVSFLTVIVVFLAENIGWVILGAPLVIAFYLLFSGYFWSGILILALLCFFAFCIYRLHADDENNTSTKKTKLAVIPQQEQEPTLTIPNKEKITVWQWIGYILLAPIVIPIVLALVILVGGILLSPIVCLFLILDLSSTDYLLIAFGFIILIVTFIFIDMYEKSK